MNKYCVVRTDLLNGTYPADGTVSLRFYGADGNPAEVENGVIAELSVLEDNQRQIWKATAATASSDLSECVLIASPELMRDERKHNLYEFVNEAGNASRGYTLRHRGIFSVTAEGFIDGTMPEIGSDVGVGSGGKLDASGSGLGKVIAIEQAGYYTYYVIKIGKIAGDD